MIGLHKIPYGLRFFSPVVLIASFGGSGLLRPASGTCGSLVSALIGFFLLLYINQLYFIIISLVLYFIGVWACRKWIAQNDKDQDPSAIVIDEAAAMFLCLAFVPPNWVGVGVGFLLFRFFDIVKPWPVNWVDKSCKGAHGIMLDDSVAAAWTIGMIFTLSYFNIL